MRRRLILFLRLFVAALVTQAGAEEGDWPGVEYKYVRAYLYGSTMERTDILIDGNINPSVEKVARLTREQIAAVGRAIYEPTANRASSKSCYFPHHAIVYFDQFDRPAAWLEICFDCENYRAVPLLPPDRKIKIDALLPLLRAANLPCPGDEAYREFRRQIAHDGKSQAFQSLYEEDPRIKDGTIPLTERYWPYRPVTRAKLIEFNLKGDEESVVRAGRVTASVESEVTLTGDQVASLWRCISRREWGPRDEKTEQIQGEGGTFWIRSKAGRAMERVIKPVGRPRFRHALICFDEKERPIAWIDLAFADGVYRTTPHEMPRNENGYGWEMGKLRAAFAKAGIGIRSEEEYQREEDELRK